MIYYLIDKPKLGIYVWATRANMWDDFIGFKLKLGTYSGLNLSLLGLLVHVTIAMGNWHPKYKARE